MTWMRMGNRSTWTIGIALLFVAILLPAGASAASVHAAPAAAPTPPQTWAYGALVWQNYTALSSAYTETVRTYVGVQVITTIKNVTATISEMNEVYTEAETYYVQYCEPSCAAPTLSENYSETYLATTSEWLNLTNYASVHEGTTTARAYGIVNASSVYTENLTELYLGLQGSSLYYKGSYFLQYNAVTAIAFTPALGLIPAKSTTGLTWNSTSAYRATGGWLESYAYYYTEPGIGYNYSYNLPKFSGSDTLAGNETVAGSDLGPVTLAGGTTARSIDLTYTGAYDIALGYLLTPAGGYSFEGNSGWSVGIAPAAITASVVDVASSGGSNSPEVVGASTSWTVGPSALPGNVTAPSSPGQSTTPTNTGTVQAQPEPLPYAQAVSQCIAGGCSSGALPATPAARLGSSWMYLALGLVGAIGAGAAVAIVAVRRRHGRAPP
jgi:hypothetical protein